MYRFSMAIDDYKPGRFEYPLEDKDKYNAKIQFEIVTQEPPKFQADLKSVLNWTAREDQAPLEEGAKRPPRPKKSSNISPSIAQQTGKKVDIYVPQAHTISDVFVYDNPALNLAGGALQAGMQGGLDVSSAIVSAAKEGMKGVGDLIDAFGGKALTRAAVVRAATAAPVPQSVKDAIGVTARTSLHPNLRTRFQNVGIRQFSFTFKFIPRSRDEAVVVKQIIEYFRFHAYPEEIPARLSESVTFPIAYKYPDMFKIKLFAREFESGNLVYKRTGTQLLDCFLTSITTTYNPTAAVYHYDGEPVETDLTLNFMEHRPLSRKDVNSTGLGFTSPSDAQEQSGPF